MDKAQYALGIPKEGREEEARLCHQAFVELVRMAYNETQDESIGKVLAFLQSPLPAECRSIPPDDLVTFRVNAGGPFPFELPSMQRFWLSHLGREIVADAPAFCSACGQLTMPVRILTRELVVFGQKCQISSLNLSAFTHLGKEQLTNSPLCFDCASSAVDAADYLIRSEQHRAVLVEDREDPRRSQLAIFWLARPVILAASDQEEVDIEAMVAAVLTQERQVPKVTPALENLHNLLQLPWKPAEFHLEVPDAFYLAVISPNKARLVIREWIFVSLAHLRARLRRYLDALRRPYVPQRLPAITEMVSVLGEGDPNLSRALLRIAFLGQRPHQELKVAASNRLRLLVLKETDQGKEEVERNRQRRRQRQRVRLDREREQEVLLSVLNLALFYGKEEDEIVSYLANSPAYLCGRLLAVLEAAQQRAHWAKGGGRLDSTIVQRFYGTASTAPAAAFATLLRLAAAAHLPDAGGELNRLVEEIASELKEVGGFPRTLSADQQAEFHLGFFSQRAELRARRQTRQDEQEETQEETEE